MSFILVTLDGETVHGTAGDDILNGTAGRDIFNTHITSGADTMTGGLGDDAYFVNSVDDVVVENANEGIDTVVVSKLAQYALAQNLENLTIRSGIAIGNDGNNILRNRGGVSTLIGGKGDDVLNGSSWVTGGSTSDVTTYEFNQGDGTDTVQLGVGKSVIKLNMDASQVQFSYVNHSTAGSLSFAPAEIDLVISYQGGTVTVRNIFDPIATTDTSDKLTGAFTGVTQTTEMNHLIQFNDATWSMADLRNALNYHQIPTAHVGYEEFVGTSGDDVVGRIRVADASGRYVGDMSRANPYSAIFNPQSPETYGSAAVNWDNALYFGGKGNDTINAQGALGSDTFMFNAGDGTDTINHTNMAMYVSMGGIQTINYSDTTFGKFSPAYVAYGQNGLSAAYDIVQINVDVNQAKFLADGDNLVVQYGANDKVVITDYFRTQNPDGYARLYNDANAGIDYIQFNNKTFKTSDIQRNTLDAVNLQLRPAIVGTAGRDVLSAATAVPYLGANLEGGAGNDALTGSAGADKLDGGLGRDTMNGGAGNDIYVVDNARDVVTENLNEGQDTVQSLVSYTLGATLENLTLTGTSNTNGTGNELNNVLMGNSGNNTLRGGAGNDTLDGAGGTDRLFGGLGDDSYMVNSTDVTITEYANQGFDTVYAGVDYTFAANIEKAVLTGSENLNLTGNRLANTLQGNAGSNIINGGAGNDTLIGGLGGDKYVFQAGDGKDIVVDGKIVLTTGFDLSPMPPMGVDTFTFVNTASNQLWFERAQVGGVYTNDLIVKTIGKADQVTIEDWFSPEHFDAGAQFQAADGKILDGTEVDALVDAMAAFAPPRMGQTTLPSNYQSVLNPVLAANWS